MFNRFISFISTAALILGGISLPVAHAQLLLGLPEPGTMVALTPAYEPAMVRGVTVSAADPFRFKFLVDIGQDKLQGEALKAEGEKMIKYFLASLTIPEKDWWVNLSPYEQGRIIPDALGRTDLGRDLLAQDYILKQITASLIYPEKELGKRFWDRIYAQVQERFGANINVPLNTFNKVWIMSDKAEVFEHHQTAIVTKCHLKVMLEEDYLATLKHAAGGVEAVPFARSVRGSMASSPATPRGDGWSEDKRNSSATGPAHAQVGTQQVVREIVLPEIEREVNEGRSFASLRQIYHALILASWYKKRLKDALLNQAYADRSLVKGIDLKDPTIKEQIYTRYLQAYKKGVFNFIKEETVNNQPLPRKYFSGGVIPGRANDPHRTVDSASLAAFPKYVIARFEVGAIPGELHEMDTVIPTNRLIDRAMNGEMISIGHGSNRLEGRRGDYLSLIDSILNQMKANRIIGFDKNDSKLLYQKHNINGEEHSVFFVTADQGVVLMLNQILGLNGIMFGFNAQSIQNVALYINGHRIIFFVVDSFKKKVLSQFLKKVKDFINSVPAIRPEIKAVSVNASEGLFSFADGLIRVGLTHYWESKGLRSGYTVSNVGKKMTSIDQKHVEDFIDQGPLGLEISQGKRNQFLAFLKDHEQDEYKLHYYFYLAFKENTTMEELNEASSFASQYIRLPEVVRSSMEYLLAIIIIENIGFRRNAAMISSKANRKFVDVLSDGYGGIDLQKTSADMKITQHGPDVQMKVDQAQSARLAGMVARVKHDGIQSLSPVIYHITPVTNIWQELGIKTP